MNDKISKLELFSGIIFVFTIILACLIVIAAI